MKQKTKKLLSVMVLVLVVAFVGAFIFTRLVQRTSRHSGVEAAPPVPLTEPRELCNEPLLKQCVAAQEIERCLSGSEFEILQATRPKGGTQGARVLTVRCRAEGEEQPTRVLRAKWRDAEAGVLSEPRRELVAYKMQSLFLDPSQFVVPPVVARCIPAQDYQKHFDSIEESGRLFPSCMLGYLSFWLIDVELGSSFARERGEDRLYSPALFETDPVYARKVARLNLLAIFIRHGDSHAGQFVVAQKPFRLFSIDHSLSLTEVENPMVLVRENWSELIVPAVPATLAKRVLSITKADVERLQLVAHLVPLHDGMVQAAQLPERWDGPFEKVKKSENGLLIGTTQRERQIIWTGIDRVQQALEDGRLETFVD